MEAKKTHDSFVMPLAIMAFSAVAVAFLVWLAVK